MSLPTLEFWYDFASTYSYPAAMTVARRAADAGAAVVWRPFLLGPVFHAQQGIADSPFNLQKEKGALDVARPRPRVRAARASPFAEAHRLPAQLALRRPRRPGLRGGGAGRRRLLRAVFDANFARDQDISDVGRLGEICAEIDYPGGEVMARAATDPVKQALKDQTAAAMAKGLFGAPSFVADDGELFWGFDRMEEALAYAASPQRQDA